MGADKNSSKEELDLYTKIISKRPRQLLSRSRSNQRATDPRNNTATQVLETRSGKQPEHSKPSGRSDRPTGAVRLPGAGSPVHHTPGHPSRNRDKPGHPSNTRRVTRPTNHRGPTWVQGGLTAYQGRLDRLPLENWQQHESVQSRVKSFQSSNPGLSRNRKTSCKQQHPKLSNLVRGG